MRGSLSAQRLHETAAGSSALAVPYEPGEDLVAADGSWQYAYKFSTVKGVVERSRVLEFGVVGEQPDNNL